MVARAWLALGTALSACAPNGDSPRLDRPGVPPSVVALSSTNNAFQAPDTISAGWTTFRFSNHGDDIHYAHIVQLDSARTVSDLVQAYAEAIRMSRGRPAWVKRVGGPGGVAPGDTAAVTQFLEAGSYVWICPVEDSAGTPHFGMGEYKPFVVRARTDTTRQAAPVASTVIRLRDFSFDAPLSAGRHVIGVENTGAEPHDLVLMKLMPGTTLAQVQAWLNPEKARRPGQAGVGEVSPASLVSLAGGVAAMAPGMQAFFEMDLTPGDYVLACMATAPDGRSHIEHGMIQQVTVR